MSLRSKDRRASGWRRIAGVVVAVLAAMALVLLVDAWAALGTSPSGARLERISRSAQYRDGKFVDTLPRVDPDVVQATLRWIQGTANSAPAAPIPILLRRTEEFEEPSDLRVTWLGHSSLLVELEGHRVLFDPIFSERSSPSRLVGPKRFHPVPISLDSLPRIDAVAISHDHYDHLDYRTILGLKARKIPFLVPLGVGAHLEYWGVDAQLIRELDWWDETRVGRLRIVATPARHFSGRGLGADRTLWAGWALIGDSKRAYYSGDTAMFGGFEEIGKRLGPFDATMIEVGAYDAMWADVHLGPEQAVQAHRAVRGGVLVPVHWGTFNLALHSWIEPAERVLVASRENSVSVVTPIPGQTIDIAHPPPPKRWWPQVPWKTSLEAPVVSSGLEGRR